MAAVDARPVIVGLSRVELSRMARHPLSLLGVAGLLWATWVMTGTDEWRAALTGFGLLPLLMCGFPVLHLAVTRDHRRGAGELASSLPVGPSTRTSAHLVAAAFVASVAGAAWVGFALVVVGSDGTMTVSTWSFPDLVWTPSWAEFVQPLLIAVAVLVLAVAVASWWRHPVAAFLVPLMLFMTPLMWFVPPVAEGGLVERSGRLVEVPASAVVWHLAYLVGWIALAAAVALLRHDRRPVLALVAGVGVAAIVVGFVLGPLPIS